MVNTKQDNLKQTVLARAIAAEDIERGMYVTPLYRVDEFMPHFSVDDVRQGTVRPVQVQWLPYDGGEPLMVLEVCLPFVLALDQYEMKRSIDTRQVRLARISERYGRRALKRKHRKGGSRRRKRRSCRPG